jgi:hypothetical protein
MNPLKNRDGVNIERYLKFHPELLDAACKAQRASKAHFAAAHGPMDALLKRDPRDLTPEACCRRQGEIDSTGENERVACREYVKALHQAGFRDSFALLRRVSGILDATDKKAEKSQKIRALLE